MADLVYAKLAGLGAYLAGAGFVYSPLYLLTSLAIAAVFWMVCKPRGSMLGFLFPRKIHAHPSSRLDLRLATFNAVLIGLGGLSFAIATPIVAVTLVDASGSLPAADATAGLWPGAGVALALVLFLIDDLCRYLLHLVHHKVPVLWPFHEVHHSAEVLSPLTFFRAHPVYFFVQTALISACSGVAQAAVAILAFGWIDPWVFYAATLPSLLYMLCGVHLRHSHVPLRYGRVAEWLLISPYLHQIHHSIDPAHRDRNFGEVLSIWDRLFGTLHLAHHDQPLAFGLTDDHGNRVQPYPGMTAALFAPFAKAATSMTATLSWRKTRAEHG